MSYPATSPIGGTPTASPLGPTTGLASRRSALLALSLLLALALGPLAACDTASLDEAPPERALTGATHSESDDETDIVIVETDGTLRAFVGGEAGIEVASPGGNRVGVLVTGSATFSASSLPQLLLNVRQTARGEINGGGRVTLHSTVTGLDHTTNFTAVCIKPVQGWGRTSYGVTVALDEPYRPYGSLAYTHVAISLTEDGHVGPLVMNTRPFCGGSITLTPPENRLAGNVQVILPGQ